jgi:hypothetical protein
VSNAFSAVAAPKKKRNLERLRENPPKEEGGGDKTCRARRVTASARHEDIMKAEFVQCKNIWCGAIKKLDSSSGILKIINIFNLLELNSKARKWSARLSGLGRTACVLSPKLKAVMLS